MKISVIIPVYNVEKYLEQCIDSVLCQSYSDFELLLINDGSTDNSGVICDQYATKDARIRVFHKTNGGVSSARNLGIKKAIGEWIAFIDSDDFVADLFLYDFTENLTTCTDLIIQGIKRYSVDIKIFYEFDHIIKTNKVEFLNNFKIIPYFFGPVSKLYKKDIIRKHNLQFDISKSYAEDTIFNLDYLYWCANDIILLNKNNYYYRNTPDSLSTQKLNFAERLTLFDQVKKRLLALTSNNNHYYWYSAELLRALYSDCNIHKRRKILAWLVKENKEQLVVPFKQRDLFSNLIYLLIKTENIFILNLLFKWSYRKKNQ